MAWDEQPWAFALALIQAALGCAMLWGLDSGKILGSSFPSLFRERSALCWIFVVLDLALGVVAGNRGFEFSLDGMLWQVPAGVSFLLGLMFPWAMTYTLHFGIVSLAESIAPITAGLAAFCAFLFQVVLPAIWIRAFPISWFIPLTAAILLMAAAYFAVSFILWSTIVFNDCIRELLRVGRGEPAPELPDFTEA